MRTRVAFVLIGLALTLAAGAQTTPRQLRLTEVLRIDGAKEDISGALPNAWIGRDGRVAVFDSPTARFVFFDSLGKRLGTFGGRGSGPGEFEPNAGTMFALRQGALLDTMWVYASNGRRFTLISPELKLARTFVLPQFDASTIVAFFPFALLPNNRVLGQATLGERVATVLPDGTPGTTFRASDTTIVVMAADGSIVQRITRAPFNTAMAVIPRPGGRSAFVPIPFAVPPLVVPAPAGDRFAIVSYTETSRSGGTYQLTVIRTTGDTVFSRVIPYTGTPVSKALADSTMAERARMPGTAADITNALRERMPTSMAPFSNVDVGTDGTIWLRRYAPSTVPAQFLVFSASGDVVGEATLPRAGIGLWAATRTTAWATQTDNDGFVSIVRYRVDPP